jgi:hypothetical protein
MYNDNHNQSIIFVPWKFQVPVLFTEMFNSRNKCGTMFSLVKTGSNREVNDMMQSYSSSVHNEVLTVA